MAGKGAMQTLTVFVALLFLGQHVESQCPAYPVNGTTYCQKIVGLMDLRSALENGISDVDACIYSLRQYACAFSESLSADALASILKCYVGNPDAIVTESSLVLLFSKASLQAIKGALDTINIQLAAANITQTTKGYMLRAVWERLRSDPTQLTDGFLAVWFQQRLFFYLTAINSDILNCMTQIPLNCSGLEIMIQALDAVYLKMDNSTRLLVVKWNVEFLSRQKCVKSSGAEWISTYWKSFRFNATYRDFIMAWPAFNETAALDSLTATQMAEYTVASNALTQLSSAEAALQVLNRSDLSFAIAFLSHLETLTPQYSSHPDVTYALLEMVLTKLNTNLQDICSPSLKDLFQVTLKRLLLAVNETVLNLLPTNISCSDFHNIYGGIDFIYNQLSPENQRAVYNARWKYLNMTAYTEGSACTFGSVSSRQWLQDNWGSSSIFLPYDQIIQFNPKFNGFEAADMLTADQLVGLLTYSKILTDVSQQNVDANITAIINSLKNRNFSVFEEFIDGLNQTVSMINNVKVRMALMAGFWDMLQAHFLNFASSGWESWILEKLTLFLPSITKDQLEMLNVTNDCAKFQSIVKGLDNVFDNMPLETKIDVARWIEYVLTSTKCPSSDWLVLNWQRFSLVANISQFTALNPDFDPITVLDLLTPVQMGQAVLKNEVLASISTMEKVFDAMEMNMTQEEITKNLAAFWDEFNTGYEKASASLNISTEVKYTMLNRTTENLKINYSTFNESQIDDWFGQKLYLVIPTIDAGILSAFPVLPCALYTVFISALSNAYDEMADKNKNDCISFMSSSVSHSVGAECSQNVTLKHWILNYYGNFSGKLTYSQLMMQNTHFDPYEEEVLSILTEEQVGQMMVQSNTLTRMNETVKLVHFFQGHPMEFETSLKEFTKVAIKSDLVLENVDVAQYIMVNYLKIAGERLRTLTAEEWETLLTSELLFFLFAVNQESLTFIIPADCRSLNVIVEVLNQNFDEMSDAASRDVAKWIRTQLKSHGLGRCLNSSLSMEAWIGLYWQKFITSATFTEVTETNPNFNPSEVLNLLSTEQLVQYIFHSDALTNVTTMEKALLSLRNGEEKIALTTIDKFLTLFNNATKIPWTADVGEKVLTIIFTDLAQEFSRFNTTQYEHFFQNQLINFLQYFTTDLLQLIPKDISCQSYSAIMKGFDKVFSKLSDESGKNICMFMKEYLSKQLQLQDAGVCMELYSDSESYIQNIFFHFSIYVSYFEFSIYYKNFKAFDVLQLLSATQLGSMMVNSSAIRNERKAVLILDDLAKRSLPEVRKFLIALGSEAKTQSIEVLPDSKIQSLILETVFWKMDFKNPKGSDLVSWFSKDLPLLLGSITKEQLAMIPMDIDCQSQQSLVQGLGQVSKYLDESQQKAIYERINTYLTKKMSTQGDTCSSSANCSTWITNNYGAFSGYATVEEFKTLKTDCDMESALSVFSGEQLADHTLASGALDNETSLRKIFEHLTSTEELNLYFTKLYSTAQEELQASPYKYFILNATFKIISQDFSAFKRQDWALWLQKNLALLLDVIDEDMLNLIPTHRTCEAHQQIVKAFSDEFHNFSETLQKTIYNTVIRNFFNSSSSTSGIVCEIKTQKTQEWIDTNFGRFIILADYLDLLHWNRYFDSLKVLDTVGYTQLADITLQSNALTEEDTSCLIVARLQQANVNKVYQYLDQFYLSAQKLNISSISNLEIRRKMLVTLTELLQKQFDTYNPEDWNQLLTVRLRLFLPSLTGEEMKLFLSSASCDSYLVIVEAVSFIFDSLTDTDRRDIYNTFLTFLQNQYNETGNACEKSGEGSKEWKQNVLGPFAEMALYEDILSIRSTYNGMEDLESLSSSQLASLCFQNNILNNYQDVDVIMNTLVNKTFDDVQTFLETFQKYAIQQNLVSLTNVDVRYTIFNSVFYKMSSRFSSFSVFQWKDFFQSKLSYFIASINASTLQLIPKNIQCGIFQIIMAGLDAHSSEMSAASQKDVCNMAKSFLLKKQLETNSACIESTRGSIGWLQSNVASFTGCFTYQELMDLNQDFSITIAAGLLPPKLLADYTVSSDVLRDGAKAGKIIDALSSANLAEYLDHLKFFAAQKGLTQLPNAEVGKVIIEAIYCHFSSQFPTYSNEDYVKFLYRIKFFIGYPETLKCFRTDMSCQTLAALMAIFSDLAANSTIEDPEAVSSFVTESLKFHKANSGSACTQGLTGDREWLLTYYGYFRTYPKFSDFVSLKSDFQCGACSDILSASQLASVSTQTSIIYNVSAISMVLDFSKMNGNLGYLAAYMDSFNEFVMKNPQLLENVKVRYTIFMACANALFPKFATMSSDNVTMWLSKMKYVLPSINGTSLELLSTNLPCPHYQAIVASVNTNFKVLGEKSKKDIIEFMKKYLKTQYDENESACKSNTSGNVDWLQKNLGNFCTLTNLTEIQSLNPEMDGVSLNMCILSS